MIRDFKEYRRIRELLKAELRAAHDAAPGEYLSKDHKSLAPGTRTPDEFSEYESDLPNTARQAGLRAEALARQARASGGAASTKRTTWTRRPVAWTTNAPNHDRAHRATGKAKGRRPNNDSGIAGAVYTLAENLNITTDKAAIEIANWIVATSKTSKGGRLTLKAARERVRLALRRGG